MNQEIETNYLEGDKDARMWAMICHLSALSGYVIPLGNVIGPLIIWAIKKDEHEFVDDQGKEAINFQLTMTVAYIISLILILVLVGFFLLAVLCIYALIIIVVAAIKSNDGYKYRYPYTIRFFK